MNSAEMLHYKATAAWTPKKTPKQVRAELEAMHELSMVRRQLSSDNEDESAKKKRTRMVQEAIIKWR